MSCLSRAVPDILELGASGEGFCTLSVSPSSTPMVNDSQIEIQTPLWLFRMRTKIRQMRKSELEMEKTLGDIRIEIIN